MSSGAPARMPLAGVLAGTVVLFATVGAVLLARGVYLNLPEAIAVVIGSAVGSYLGWLVVVRTGHVTGWLLLGLYLVGGLTVLLAGYSDLALERSDPPLPGGVIAAWLSQLVWAVNIFGLYVLIPAYFPDGALASRGARAVIAVAAGGTLLIMVGTGLTRELYAYDDLAAPLAFLDVPAAVTEAASAVGFLVVIGGALAALGMLFVRFWFARGVRRLQLKCLLPAVVVSILFDLPGTFADEGPTLLGILSDLAIPVGLTVAITRYRLYAIDKLIRRTASYAVITAVLLAVYAGLVLGSQAFLGRDESHDLVVAGSTLAVAALFQPVRQRVQEVVDRRFNRSTADARRAVEQFSRNVRDAIEIDVLVDDLLRTARQAVQPTAVSVTVIGGAGVVAGPTRPRVA